MPINSIFLVKTNNLLLNVNREKNCIFFTFYFHSTAYINLKTINRLKINNWLSSLH